MRVYELMIIIDRDVDDAGVQARIAATTEAIEAENGVVASLDNWGKRRFAYEIDHKNEGTYLVLEIVTEAADLSSLERQLRIADDVVRHKVIRLPEKEVAKRGLLGGAAEPAAAG